MNLFSFFTVVLFTLSALSLQLHAQMCPAGSRARAISVPDHIPNSSVTAKVLQGSKAYPSKDLAAMAAFRIIRTLGNSKTFEYSGCLYKNKEVDEPQYFHTEPVTNRSSDGIRITCVSPNEKSQLVGIYHTHPLTDEFGNQDGFSAHDVEIADKLNVTSYVGTMKTRNILRYISCKTRKECLESERFFCRQKMSRGEKIGTF